MASYRCYQLNGDNKIHQPHDIEADSDADALQKAENEIVISAALPAIEIWQGKRLVGRVTFQPTAAAAQ